MNPVYVDTNVFVYAGSDDRERRDKARRALERSAKVTGLATTYLTISEFVWVIRGRSGFQSAVDAAARLLEMPDLRILSLPAASIPLAIELMARHGLTPNDAGHAASAIHHGCSGILTFDSDFEKVPDLRAMRP